MKRWRWIMTLRTKTNEYTLQDRTKNFGGMPEIQWERFGESYVNAMEWANGLIRDISYGLLGHNVKEHIKDGKFNVHYRWDPKYKPTTWVPLEDFVEVGFYIYLERSFFRWVHRKQYIVATVPFNEESRAMLRKSAWDEDNRVVVE